MSKGIEHYAFDGKIHFKVEDVKQYMPDMKIDTSMIKEKSENGIKLLLVSDEAISEMTEFDKKIVKLANFDAKK